MENAIVVKNLTKKYEGFTLNNISFQIPKGSIVGFVGENGAGKSTTIKAILGLLTVESGEIELLGHKIKHGDKETAYKEHIGVVFDENNFPGDLRVKYIHKVMKNIYRTWNDDKFCRLLKRFELPEGKKVKELSKGMKMKLSLSAALAHRPKLLILDEATAGLDPVVRDEILDEFLGFIRDEDHAVLMSSHITSDLEKVADYIAYIHQGQVVLSDAKDNILDSYGRVGCTAAQLETIDPRDILRTRKGTFGCEALVGDRVAFSRKYPMLLVERTTLEDIMLFVGKGETK